MSDDDEVFPDNVVQLNPGEKFTVSEGRRKDETQQQYRNRYRKEKRDWERRQGIPAPQRKRVRLSKSETKIRNGEVDFSKLSIEELVAGKLKDVNGKMSGRPPKMVSREFHQMAIKEVLKRGDQLFQQAYVAAVATMVGIMLDPDAEAKDKHKAAQFIVERVGGKTPERIDVGITTDPWQAAIDGIIAHAEDEQISKAREILDNAATE